MAKAIIYTRVSSDRQVEEGHSLDSQDRICRQFAESKGLELAREPFVEEGESAKTADRTRLKELLKYVAEHKGEVEYLIVYKVDRLSRDTGDYLAIKQALLRAGVNILSVTENFDDTPIGRVMETIASSFAQYDNELRAERSRGGMMDAVRAGRFTHLAPIGFINTKVNGASNVAPDPRDGLVATLRLAWVLMDDGCSETEARKRVNTRLEELGYKKLAKQTFSRMVKNKLYKGVVCGFGLEVQSRDIVPIVEPELFDRVQAILRGNRNLGNKYHKVNPEYSLRGVLWCKNGHKMTGSSPRGRNGTRYPKYHCPKCRGQHISYDVGDTDGRFMDYAKTIRMKRNIQEALKEAIRLNLDGVDQQNAKEKAQLEKQLLTNKAEKKEVAHNLIKGVIPEKTAQELLADYEQEETEIRLKLNQLDGEVEDVEELMELGIGKLSNLAQTFTEITDPNIRFRFQKWLFPVGLVFDGERFGTSKIPLILSVRRNTLAGVSGEINHVVGEMGFEPIRLLVI